MMIQANPNPKPWCNRECKRIMGAILLWTIPILICFGLVAGLHALVHWLNSGDDQPDTHITFSIVSVSVSELNPNASSSPEFHIVFQAKKAFENSTDMCLYSESTNISYHGINIASVVNDIDYDYNPPYCYYNMPPYCSNYDYYDYNPSCYNMDDESEFVIPVQLSESVPRYLRKQLWEEREIIVLDLEMNFTTFWNWNWIYYHVWCNNVTVGAVDTRVACNATIM